MTRSRPGNHEIQASIEVCPTGLADLTPFQFLIVARTRRNLHSLPCSRLCNVILDSYNERDTPYVGLSLRQSQSNGRAPDPNDDSTSSLQNRSRV